mgnify:CR=1 FL=1
MQSRFGDSPGGTVAGRPTLRSSGSTYGTQFQSLRVPLKSTLIVVDTFRTTSAGCSGSYGWEMCLLRVPRVSLSLSLPVNDAAAATKPLVLRPRRGWAGLGVAELVRYRDLLWFLALRDIKVRYKQTALGALWAVLQPVAMMVVLSVFFGRLARFDQMAGTTPYPIFFYAGMLPWTFFAAAVNAAGNSLVNNGHMLRKIYFPRLILPLSALGAPLLDFVIAFSVLIGLMVWYDIVPGVTVALLPVLVAMLLATALGVGLLLAAMTVNYRDFRHTVPFLLQVWFFLTPVIYPVTLLPERYRWLSMINPMGGAIEAFRAAMLGTPIAWLQLLSAVAAATVCLLAGLLYFTHTERRFADLI